jgi:hypothetical protein
MEMDAPPRLPGMSDRRLARERRPISRTEPFGSFTRGTR